HQESKLSRAAVRLACVRPAASVHSEPGSNSSLKYCGSARRLRLCFECSVVPAQITRSLASCDAVLDSFGLCRTSANGQPSTRQTSAQVTCAHCQRSSEPASAPRSDPFTKVPE